MIQHPATTLQDKQKTSKQRPEGLNRGTLSRCRKTGSHFPFGAPVVLMAFKGPASREPPRRDRK